MTDNQLRVTQLRQDFERMMASGAAKDALDIAETLLILSNEPTHWRLKGQALGALGQYEESLAAFQQVLSLHDLAAQQYKNRGPNLSDSLPLGVDDDEEDDTLGVLPENLTSMDEEQVWPDAPPLAHDRPEQEPSCQGGSSPDGTEAASEPLPRDAAVLEAPGPVETGDSPEDSALAFAEELPGISANDAAAPEWYPEDLLDGLSQEPPASLAPTDQIETEAVPEVAIDGLDAGASPALLVDMALCEAEQGNTREGLRILEEAAQYAPDSLPIRYNQAVMYLEAGSLEDAQIAIDRAAECGLPRQEFLLLRANLALAEGQTVEAMEAFREVLQCGPPLLESTQVTPLLGEFVKLALLEGLPEVIQSFHLAAERGGTTDTLAAAFAVVAMNDPQVATALSKPLQALALTDSAYVLAARVVRALSTADPRERQLALLAMPRELRITVMGCLEAQEPHDAALSDTGKTP